MSSSRKRFRPLDPGEERDLHTTDPLQITPLDDERSYCFSWPGAALTAWMNAYPAYTEMHIYKSATAAAAAAATTTTASSSSTAAFGVGGGGGAAASAARGDGSIASGTLIATPPVFLVHELLARGAGGTSTFSGDTEEEERGHEAPRAFATSSRAHNAPPSAAGTAPHLLLSSRHVGLSACEDVSRLLAPFAAASSTARGRTGGGGAACIAMPPGELPRVPAHPLSPPRPLCTGEDSIFTLNEAQRQDACALHLITADADGADNNDRVATDCAPVGDPTELRVDLRKRRRLEWEVVGLEWRAFKESQRTAAALQRLLSLEAAVPVAPSGPHSSGGSGNPRGTHRGEDGAAGVGPCPAAPWATEEWRQRVYRLWLLWRVGSSGGGDGTSGLAKAATIRTEQEHGPSPPAFPLPLTNGSASTTTTAAAALSPFAAACARGGPGHAPPPWGAPLMPGAYLYDTQADYFLNPARTSSAVAAAAPAAGRGGGKEPDVSTARRRRGPYNFLRWKVEHYTPQLASLLAREEGEGVAGPRPSSGAARGTHLTLEHPAFAPLPTRRQRQAQRERERLNVEEGEDAEKEGEEGSLATQYRGGGGNTLLNAHSVDVLVTRVVLAHPLVELEQDVDRRQDRLDALAWTDLKRDTEMWRTWLSKV